MRAIPFVIAIVVVLTTLSGCITSEESGTVRASVGDFNKYYLRDDKYTKLIIEIDFVTGFEPSTGAVNLLKDRINENCDKLSVTVSQQPFESNDNKYTLKEIKNLESDHRSHKKKGDTIVVHFLYLNGRYSESDAVLGLAYYADAIAIFKERIEDVATTQINNPLLVSDEDIEKAVLVHEFGHLLGLVNINYRSQTDHEDSDSKHHCIHEDCVMNADVETNAIAAWINTGDNKPPTDFRPECKDDIRILREG